NQRMARELARLRQSVGREGRINQRASLGEVGGTWAESVELINDLVADLVRPTSEMARVIGAVRSSNPQSGWFRLEVIDSGIGIASDVLPKIFDPFEQGDRAGSGGLGLGLTICKAI